MKSESARFSLYSATLSELLGQLRQHAGLSPKEVAARGGLSVHTVATCERYCGRLGMDKVFRFIQGVGFEYLPVFYEVEERLELAGQPSLSGKKRPRPGVFFKDLYDKGMLDRQEINRQLRIMRKLRQPVAR